MLTTAEAPVVRAATTVYRIPTDAPEEDGTFAWQTTTLVVVELEAGGETGLGYTYGPPAVAAVVDVSVTDGDHRVWGVPNLFVCDGSVMPTQGAANPALTIMALASRLGERLAAGRIGARGRAGTRGRPQAAVEP